MRPLVLSLTLIAALAAGPAFGEPAQKPKKRFLPSPAADTLLRGPIGAPVMAAPPASPGVGLPAPGLAFTGLGSAGFSAAPSSPSLRPVGDPAPMCRAECAKARVTCLSSDDQGCNPVWIQCVSSCSASILR